MGAFPDGSATARSAGSWHDIGTAPRTSAPPIPPPGSTPPARPPVRPQLRRSRTDKMIGGVCGGLAEYSGVDPLLWRVGFVALALAGGSGVVVYLLLWLLMPAGPRPRPGRLTRAPTAPRPYARPPARVRRFPASPSPAC